MAVRAKLTAESITTNRYGQKIIKFQTQYDTSIPEDQRFMKATPSGSAEFWIDNPWALEQFNLGDAYYVDFSPAPK